MVKAATVASLLGVHVLRTKQKGLIVGLKLTHYLPRQAACRLSIYISKGYHVLNYSRLSCKTALYTDIPAISQRLYDLNAC